MVVKKHDHEEFKKNCSAEHMTFELNVKATWMSDIQERNKNGLGTNKVIVTDSGTIYIWV